MKKIRVNVRSPVAVNAIRREVHNGRDVIVVPSATMPDDIVMNGIRYPAEAIANSYRTLERSLAPLHHPVDEAGNFLSAADPDALAGFYFGCYNSGVKREKGRVLLDKVIDVKRASESELGKRVLNAIDKGDPIHTSTGLIAELQNADTDDEADYIARNIIFDHDAILLDEPGAATPNQGVGMLLANKARDRGGAEIDAMTCDLGNVGTGGGSSALGLIAEILNRMAGGKKEADMDKDTQKTPHTNGGDDMSKADMMKKKRAMMDMDNADMKGLRALMDKMMSTNADTPRPMTNAQRDVLLDAVAKTVETTLAEGQSRADKARLVDAVVNADLLKRDVAEKAGIPVLEAVLEKSGADMAAPIVPGFQTHAKTPAYELPES